MMRRQKKVTVSFHHRSGFPVREHSRNPPRKQKKRKVKRQTQQELLTFSSRNIEVHGGMPFHRGCGGMVVIEGPDTHLCKRCGQVFYRKPGSRKPKTEFKQKIKHEKVVTVLDVPTFTGVSDSSKCFHPLNKRTFISEVQTRSADEPMTRFYRCNVCGAVVRD